MYIKNDEAWKRYSSFVPKDRRISTTQSEVRYYRPLAAVANMFGEEAPIPKQPKRETVETAEPEPEVPEIDISSDAMADAEFGFGRRWQSREEGKEKSKTRHETQDESKRS